MITTKDLAVYTYIVSFALQKDRLPSIREIMDGLGVKSTSTIYSHMTKLKEGGYITQKHRSTHYTVKGLKYISTRKKNEVRNHNSG